MASMCNAFQAWAVVPDYGGGGEGDTLGPGEKGCFGDAFWRDAVISVGDQQATYGALWDKLFSCKNY